MFREPSSRDLSRLISAKAVISVAAIASLIFFSIATEASARAGRGGYHAGGMRGGAMHAGRGGGYRTAGVYRGGAYRGGVHRSAYRNTNVYVRPGIGVGVGAAAVGAAAAGAAYAAPRCGYYPYPPCY